MESQTTMDDLLLIGTVERIDKDYEPSEGERIYYSVGQYMDSVKSLSYDTDQQIWKRTHTWIDWKYNGTFNEVTIDWWNLYSNDESVSEEEIKHHKFVVVRPYG